MTEPPAPCVSLTTSSLPEVIGSPPIRVEGLRYKLDAASKPDVTVSRPL